MRIYAAARARQEPEYQQQEDDMSDLMTASAPGNADGVVRSGYLSCEPRCQPLATENSESPRATTIGMLRDRFASAMTLDELIEGAKANQELWRAIRRRAQAPADLVERLRSLPARRHLLALTEDWCGDALNTLPPLARLVEAVPQLDLRILERDQHLDLMDTHLSGSARAIPVVMVLDEQYRELGWWGSRPAALQKWVKSEEAQRLSKDDRYLEMRRWYARDHGRTALEEIAALLERTAPIENVITQYL